MSTQYEIFKKGDYQLNVDEHSSVFDLGFFFPTFAEEQGEEGTDWIGVNSITPEQLVGIGVELIKIASYNMEGIELQQAVNDYLAKKGGYRAGVNV